jgi:hypothetical protein
MDRIDLERLSLERSMGKDGTDNPVFERSTCDRSLEYAKGIAQGAPEAVEVAGPWHMLPSLRDAPNHILEQHTACLGVAAPELAANCLPESEL